MTRRQIDRFLYPWLHILPWHWARSNSIVPPYHLVPIFRLPVVPFAATGVVWYLDRTFFMLGHLHFRRPCGSAFFRLKWHHQDSCVSCWGRRCYSSHLYIALGDFFGLLFTPSSHFIHLSSISSAAHLLVHCVECLFDLYTCHASLLIPATAVLKPTAHWLHLRIINISVWDLQLYFGSENF